MKVLAPVRVECSMLTSSTVPEADYPVWVLSTNYTAGTRVIRIETHHIYEAMSPTSGEIPENTPAKWLDLGMVNRWKLFDHKVGTATLQTGSMEYVLAPGQIITAMGFLELAAESVRVRVSDATEGVVYDKTQELTGWLQNADWYSYFFEPISRQPFALFQDLPTYRSGVITITIAGLAGETVECGVCLLGTQHEFADAVRFGASAGIMDYSKKTVDDWGNIEITQRAFSKRAAWQFLLENKDLDKLQRVLASLRATPALYVGSDRYDATLVYGFYRDFDIAITYPTHSECAIELEGLI